MASQEKRVKEELKDEEEVVQLNEQMESNNAAEEVDDNSGDDSDMEDDVNEKSTDTAKRNRYRQYSQTTLGNALQKVISHEMSAYKASIVYGVPATTLIDRVKGKEIQVEFEARMIDDSDFHGTRALLQQLFLKAHIDLSEMTNTIISQNHIGSVIKQIDIPDDDEDDEMSDDDPVLGLITVVNITEKQNLECVKQLRSMLVDKCKACCQKNPERLSQILTDPDNHVGYLISERYINIPPQISVPMFESLLKEMEKCKKKKMKYDFRYYILISKCYRPKGTDQMFYTNAEEELLIKECEFTFNYSVESERDTVVDGKWDAEDQMEALRTVLVMPSKNLSKAVENIKTVLSAT